MAYRGVNWSQNEILTLRRMFEEEQTDNAIATALNRPVTSVVLKRQQLGLLRAAAATERAWTPEEIQIVKDGWYAHKTASQMAPDLPNRTPYQINVFMRVVLGLQNRKRRWSLDEDARLKEMYLGFKDFVDIAKALERDVGTCRHRATELNLTRDRRRQHLVNRFGEEFATDPRSVDEILAGMEREKEAAALARSQEKQAQIAQVLSNMVNEIAFGGDRRLAFQKAMVAGATLQEVGNMMGLTRERVRQIVHKVKIYSSLDKLARRLVELTDYDYDYVMEAVTKARSARQDNVVTDISGLASQREPS